MRTHICAISTNDSFIVRQITHWAQASNGIEPIAHSHSVDSAHSDNWGRTGDMGWVLNDTETKTMLAGAYLRYWKNEYHMFGFFDEDTPELCIAVHPGFRGRGLGKQLLRHVAEQICSMACAGSLPRAQMSLHVEATNVPAQRLYESIGFRELQSDEEGKLLLWQPEIRIREFTIADIDGVLKLWFGSNGMGLYEDDEDSPEQLAVFLRENPGLSAIAKVYVGERPVEHAGPIGAVLCGCDGRRAYLYHMAVHQGFKRMGIGRKILDTVDEALAKKGIRKTHLLAYGNNMEAAEFYPRACYARRDDLSVFSRSVGSNDSHNTPC